MKTQANKKKATNSKFEIKKNKQIFENVTANLLVQLCFF